jgi:hypothetical protein
MGGNYISDTHRKVRLGIVLRTKRAQFQAAGSYLDVLVAFHVTHVQVAGGHAHMQVGLARDLNDGAKIRLRPGNFQIVLAVPGADLHLYFALVFRPSFFINNGNAA